MQKSAQRQANGRFGAMRFWLCGGCGIGHYRKGFSKARGYMNLNLHS